jgi:DNA-binding transcriptional LysR family regulator
MISIQSKNQRSDIDGDDMKRVDLNLLVVLDALLEDCNVTRAAARLGYTQSTISGMLARLRDLFNDPLFVRTQRGLLPTRRAQLLAAPLRQLLADSRNLMAREDFDPANTEATFTLSANDYMQQAVMIPFLSILRREAKAITLAIVPPMIAGLNEALARGEIDLAVTIPEFATPNLPSRLLYRDRYVVALRRQHPLARGETLTVDSLCSYDHVLVSPTGGSFEGPTDQALARLRRKRKVRFSVPSFLLIPEILQKNDLIALVPSRLLRQDNKLVVLEPPMAIPAFDVIAVWHTRLHNDVRHRWLRNRLAQSTRTS